MNPFNKRKMVLRQQLIGARMFEALAAMEFAEKFHTGFRKDLVTPEFDHQISIALYALTLPDIIHREEVIATIMLHDVREDYHVSDGEIQAIFIDQAFSLLVARAVDAMTKTFRGVIRDEKEVFQAIADCEIASIAKGCDRIHNLQSMVGVFTPEKQEKYLGEVNEFFFPMLKKARRAFPQQVMAYENIKFVLTSQCQLIEAALAASKV